MGRSTQRGAGMGLVLFGLAFVGVGLAVALLIPVRSGLHCGGEPPACVIERGGLALPKIRRFAITEISRVSTEASEDEDGGLLYRPVLVLKTDVLEPLRDGFGDLGNAQDEAATVRAWLAAPTGPLIRASGDVWLALVLGGIIAMIGLGLMLIGWINRDD